MNFEIGRITVEIIKHLQPDAKEIQSKDLNFVAGKLAKAASLAVDEILTTADSVADDLDLMIIDCKKAVKDLSEGPSE